MRRKFLDYYYYYYYVSSIIRWPIAGIAHKPYLEGDPLTGEVWESGDGERAVGEGVCTGGGTAVEL